MDRRRREGHDRADRVQPEREARYDPEVAAAAQGPVQVRLRLADAIHNLPVGRHHLVLDHVVAGQSAAVLRSQP